MRAKFLEWFLERAPIPWGEWLAAAVLGVGVTALALFVEAQYLTRLSLPRDVPFHALARYGNVLLAASALVYVLHWRFPSDTVGRFASGLALAGTADILCALLLHSIDSEAAGALAFAPLAEAYHATLLFTAVTMIIYLAMEGVYRDRSAGASVVAIVLAAIGSELWLMSHGPGRVHLGATIESYWYAAALLAFIGGYAGLGIAALLGFAVWRAPQRWPVAALDRAASRATTIGLVLFAAAGLAGATWAWVVLGDPIPWRPAEKWIAAVCLAYGLLLARRRAGGEPVRIARAWVVGFGISFACLLGVGLLSTLAH